MEYITREIQILKELNSKRVVRYFKTHIYNNNLMIQMEFCTDNLSNVINSKHKVFNRDKQAQINEGEYLICCKIFIELLEALRFLHEQSPPIIHRDIKPANILFSEEGIETGIFFKLCDFGLAKATIKTSQSISQDTPGETDLKFEAIEHGHSHNVVVHDNFKNNVTVKSNGHNEYDSTIMTNWNQTIYST